MSSAHSTRIGESQRVFFSCQAVTAMPPASGQPVEVWPLGKE